MDRFRYGLRLITPPAADAVSLTQAKANCSIDTADHDTVLAELIDEARSYVEENTDVCLLSQTWDWSFDRFPRGNCPLEVPRWPAQSITSISYIDTEGDPQTIDSDDIKLRIDDFGRGRLSLADWANWPSVRATPDAVTVRFVAGWSAVNNIPTVWRRAQLMLIAWWFEQREAGTYGQAAKAPIGVDALIKSAAAVDDFEDFDLGE